MTSVSKIKPHSEAFARNTEHYAGLLTTLHERMRWAIRGGGEKVDAAPY